jgi:hypothetical protein
MEPAQSTGDQFPGTPAPRGRWLCFPEERRWLPHVELTPCKIDWLHGAGSLGAGSIIGFENLSLPSIPTLLWAASAQCQGFFSF